VIFSLHGRSLLTVFTKHLPLHYARLGIFPLSCQESTLQQVGQNGKCKHSCALTSDNLDDTCDKCKPPGKIICFTPDVKPRSQHLGSDQKIVMDVESHREEASKNADSSDGKVQGIRTRLCEQIAQKTGQVVDVLQPYSEMISQKIKIEILPLPQTLFQGRDQQRSGNLLGSSDARILQNNCLIDQEVQSHHASTVCQAHFPRPLATICKVKQVAHAIDDQRNLKSTSRNKDEYEHYELLLAYMQLFPHAKIVYMVRKLWPDGKISYLPFINASNHFFDHNPQSRRDSCFVRRFSCEHAIFYIEYHTAMDREVCSTTTCTTRIMTSTPTKSDASAQESRYCGQKGPQRMFTYEHHRVFKVESKGLARQALKMVREMKMLELQKCFLDDDLQEVFDNLHPALLDAEVIQIGLKKGYDYLYKSKQRSHPGGTLA